MPAAETSDAPGGAGVRKPRRLAVTDRGILIALCWSAAGWLAALVWPVIVAMIVALILVGTLSPRSAGSQLPDSAALPAAWRSSWRWSAGSLPSAS